VQPQHAMPSVEVNGARKSRSHVQLQIGMGCAVTAACCVAGAVSLPVLRKRCAEQITLLLVVP
jgi:hypothetical protein